MLHRQSVQNSTLVNREWFLATFLVFNHIMRWMLMCWGRASCSTKCQLPLGTREKPVIDCLNCWNYYMTVLIYYYYYYYLFYFVYQLTVCRLAMWIDADCMNFCNGCLRWSVADCCYLPRWACDWLPGVIFFSFRCFCFVCLFFMLKPITKQASCDAEFWGGQICSMWAGKPMKLL